MLDIRRASSCLLVVAMAAMSAFAADGVHGTVVRPRTVAAKVEGCRIAAARDYKVGVGDVIELDYGYPVVPGAMPKKVSIKQTPGGAVDAAPLGIRLVTTPGLLGASTIGFFLEAKEAGEKTVTLVIDDNEYEYSFTVH
jgi:hypothetical protein